MTGRRTNDQHAESPDDRKLRQLMRDGAFDGRLDDEFKQRLNRELDHNYQYHRRHRMRTTLAAAAVAAVALISFRIVDVGGDNFDLQDTGTALDLGGRKVQVFEKPLTGSRVGGATLHGDSVVALTREENEKISERLAAGEGVPVKLVGFTIDGSTWLTAFLAVEVDGETTHSSKDILEPDPRAAKTMRRFASEGAYKAFTAAVDSGLVPVTGTELMDVLGTRMLVTKWTREVDGFGPVTYWRGQPLDGS